MNETIYLEQLLYDINKVYPLILVVIGTIGNSLTIFVYTRKELFKTSTGFFFTLSAIIDTLMLYFGLPKFFFIGMWQINILNQSNFNCKFLVYFTYFLSEAAGWILIIASLDRVLIIVFPNVLRIFRKRKLQMVFISSVMVILALLNSPNLIFLELFSEKNTTECGNRVEYYFVIFNIFDLVLSFIIPFTAVASCSLILLVKIKKSKNKVIDNIKLSKNTLRYVTTIVVKDLLFIIFNLPISLNIVVNSIQNIGEKKYLESEYEAFTLALIYVFCNMILYFNYSINFFVHFYINKCFRKVFCKFFYKKSLISSSGV